MTASNKHKGSPLFNHIEDTKLRTWNRCAIVFNLLRDKGEASAKEYMGKLDEAGRSEVMGMFDCIKKFGYEAIRKQIKVSV